MNDPEWKSAGVWLLTFCAVVFGVMGACGAFTLVSSLTDDHPNEYTSVATFFGSISLGLGGALALVCFFWVRAMIRNNGDDDRR